MAHKKITPKEKRKLRIRRKITGMPERPRLSVFRSNRYLYAQIIDDINQKTLASASSLKEDKKCNKATGGVIGKLIAEKARAKNITQVVFDRGGNRYHGVIRELAEAARKGGLKF